MKEGIVSGREGWGGKKMVKQGDEEGSGTTDRRMDEDTCRQEERVKVIVESDGEALGVKEEWCMRRGGWERVVSGRSGTWWVVRREVRAKESERRGEG